MKSIVVVPILLALVTPGCRELAMPPAGSYSEVLLVTEEGEDDRWYDAVAPMVTRPYDYVIAQESGFRIFPMRAAELEDFPTYKNIVICGPLDTSTETGRRIQGLIGPPAARGVMEGKATILKKEDLPSPGQVTVIVTAATAAELEIVIEERGEELRDVLEASCRERLRRHLLTNPDTELITDLERRFGFHIGIPAGLYTLFSDDGRPPGVELLRQPPARVLGVYWVDREGPPTVYDRDELFDIRAEYVWRRYDHDKMDRDKVDYRYIRLGDYDAVRMDGYWYNDDAVAGGYFETYFVHDPDAELLWAVDLVVYAPGRDKHPLVRELQALAETFRYL